MTHRFVRIVLICFLSIATIAVPGGEPSPIRHSFIVFGHRTAIIAESGEVEWEHRGRSRDGFVLPNGHVLIAWSDLVQEVTRDKQVVFEWKLSADNREIGTTQRLYNGNTLVTELGPQPRLLEITPDGRKAVEVTLVPETDNAHMQTRMARQLRSGNYLVPHLLAFRIKEYDPNGVVVRSLATDGDEIGGRSAENWPFTAIRLDNGNTVTSLTHGNKVVEYDPDGVMVWKVDNTDVDNRLRDPCGVQRLANGNTVIGSHGVSQGASMIEVDRDRRIVWNSAHPAAAAVHHFQILSTNGRAEPGMPLK